MSTINDYCPNGGWLIDKSNSKQIIPGAKILVTKVDDKHAKVQIVLEGDGTLTDTGNLMVPLGKNTLDLSVTGGRLYFAWAPGQGGQSPDGGGSGGNPGGHG